jgi:hypothetical protein
MAREREMVLLKYFSRLRQEHPYWSLRRISLEVSNFTTRRRIVDRVARPN